MEGRVKALEGVEGDEELGDGGDGLDTTSSSRVGTPILEEIAEVLDLRDARVRLPGPFRVGGGTGWAGAGEPPVLTQALLAGREGLQRVEVGDGEFLAWEDVAGRVDELGEVRVREAVLGVGAAVVVDAGDVREERGQAVVLVRVGGGGVDVEDVGGGYFVDEGGVGEVGWVRGGIGGRGVVRG